MNKKTLYVLGTLLLLGFAGFAYSSFQQSLTPYVTYQEARVANRTVQVAGGLLEGSSQYDSSGEAMWFSLVDPESSEELRVQYKGLRPANFEDAVSIVAIGRWQGDHLLADKLLVKCPSKYQGLEEKEYS